MPPSGPFEGRIALTEDDRALLNVANEGFGLTRGETGDCTDSSFVLTTTSFSSKNTGTLFSDAVLLTLFLDDASFVIFPGVGTRGPEPAFLISIGLAVTVLATIELLLLPSLGTCGTAGDLAFEDTPDGVVDPDFTLTMFAWPALNACTAGTGGTTAFSPYRVDRAKEGARLIRGLMEDVSDQVEFRRSPGIKKCCSTGGVEVVDKFPDMLGKPGIGGGIPGDSGGDLTVTPGMYAIGITFEARERTVEAIEWAADWRAFRASVD